MKTDYKIGDKVSLTPDAWPLGSDPKDTGPFTVEGFYGMYIVIVSGHPRYSKTYLDFDEIKPYGVIRKRKQNDN